MTEPLYLVQFKNQTNQICCAILEGGMARPAAGGETTYDLANRASANRQTLAEVIAETVWSKPVALTTLTLVPPVTHPDPAHLHGTGTGLTHLGSATTRSAMHSVDQQETDSMRMFRWGVEGGRPEGNKSGVQPEWFYKGNGHWVSAPDADLHSPAFAGDGGEEPELAGIYMIGNDGTPYRLGFALANEFSDHVTEKKNYLYLAHSKLRPFSFGPALRVGDLPNDIQGQSRIIRNGQEIWSKPFMTGEANMSHSIANLEHHHFKYSIFRNPGDLHVHMFGTATLSFADGVACQSGDVFEISASEFGPSLQNRLIVASQDENATRIEVKQL